LTAETRRAYRTDLRHWLAFCAAHGLHPFRGLRRTHIELYLRDLEAEDPPPASATRYRRIATLSSWLRWLEDEDLNVGNPAARVRRPQRHPRPQPWLDRNQLTDLLAAAEGELPVRGRVSARSQRPACLRGMLCRCDRSGRDPLPANPADRRQR